MPATRCLAAPARAPATHTPIAASVPRHDAATEAAGWGVAQVHDAGQSVGDVDGTRLWPLVVRRWRTRRRV